MKSILGASTILSAVIFIGSPAYAAAQDASAVPPDSAAATPQAVQNDADAHPAAQTGAEQAGLGDIVVTAQRRSESSQRVALPVSAVSGADIAKAGITRAQDLTTLVPALTVATGAGPYTIFYVRGVGSLNGNALSDSAIAFNYDGVFVSRPSSVGGFFYDLDRVEVLKGPQGTIYGRNATGGAINVLPNKPRLNETSGNLGVEFGNYDQLTINGFVNAPLGNRTAARLSFQATQHDGYMSDRTDDDRGRAIRLQVRSELTDTLSVNVGADYFHQGGRGAGSTLLPYHFADQRVGLEDPKIGAVYASTLYFPAGNFFQPLTVRPYLNNDYYGVSATLEWHTDAGTLTIVPAYRRGNLDFLSTTVSFSILQRETDQQASVEARFASNEDGKLRYIVGGYFLKEDINSTPRYNNQFNISYQNISAPLDSYAAFGRLTYAVTDHFRLTGGLRYTIDNKALRGQAVSGNILCPALLASPGSFPLVNCIGGPIYPLGVDLPAAAQTALTTGIPQPYGANGNIVVMSRTVIDSSKSFKKLTWRAGAEFDVAPRSLLYASVERGFKAGGFFFSNDDPTYQPESLTAYTIGSKNRFMNNRLQLNAELFFWKYRGQQISQISSDSTGAITLATRNIGQSEAKGVDLEAQFLATPTTTLGADIQYLDSRYKRYVYTVPNLGSAPVTSCPVALAGASYTVDCSGRMPPYAPRWTLNLSVSQRIPLASGASIVLQGDTRHQTSILTGQEFLPAEVQPAYWLSNASVQFTSAGDRFSIGAYIRNIENTTVLGNSFPHPLAGDHLLAGSLRPPRTYGVRASVNF